MTVKKIKTLVHSMHHHAETPTTPPPETEQPTAPVAPAMGEAAVVAANVESTRNSFETRLAALRAEASTASIEGSIRYMQYGEKRRQQARVRNKINFAEPLVALYEDFLQDGPARTDFVEFLAPPTKSILKMYRATLSHELTIAAAQKSLDEAGISNRKPTYDEITKVIDLVIGGKPYRFHQTKGTNTVPIYRQKSSIATNIAITDNNVTKTGNPRAVVPESTQEMIDTLVMELKKKAASVRKVLVAPTVIENFPSMDFETESIIAGEDLPRGVLIINHSTPQYTDERDIRSTRGEEAVLTILAGAIGDKDSLSLSAIQLGRLVKDSIRNDDTPQQVSLKKLFSLLCGTTNSHLDYKNVIDTLNGYLRESELRDFITHVHDLSHRIKRDDTYTVNAFMNGMSGFRIEESVIKIAESAGYEVTPATKGQDALGIDAFIDGVPFDFKASMLAAHDHARRHRGKVGRYHAVKFVPPISLEDFDGELVVPDKRVAHILATTDFKKMIDDAVARYIKMDSEPKKQDEAEEDPSERGRVVEKEINKLTLNAMHHWRRKKLKSTAK